MVLKKYFVLQSTYSKLFVCFLLQLFNNNIFSQNNLQPIGQWRDHLPYQNAIQVVQGDKLYCTTQYNVFSVIQNDIQRYSKSSGLNDILVNVIGWDDASQQLVIAYKNSNLDILKGNIIKNIGDIKRSNVVGNKTIYSVYCKNKLAYLSTGLGIIVVDLIKYEIKDTWYIGNTGNKIKVSSFTSDDNFLYAATDEGLKRISISNNNPSDYRNWITINHLNGLTNGAIQQVSTLNNNKIVLLKTDSIFIQNNNSWSLFYNDINWPIVSINSSNNKVLVCQRKNNGSSRVLQISESGIIEKIISQVGIISFPKWATISNNKVCVADYFGGLSLHDNSIQQIIPNGPLGTATGDFKFINNTLYAAAGTVNDSWNYQYNRDGIFKFNEGTWSYKGYFNTPTLDSVFDFITLVEDKKDKSIWAGSYGGGLININSNTIKIFKQNTSLQPAIGDPNSYRVSGLAFDANQNLWISNYGAAQNLHVKKTDGSFKSFQIPFFHFENAVSDLLVDDNHQIWIVSPRGNGLFCYSPGNNIDNISDDKWKYYRAGRGNGNLPSNDIFCLTKDKNETIWVGTSKGIAIISCTNDVFNTQGCEAILPIVQQDQFAGFLFQNEEVRSIAVDGANRKWIATKNGVWLISAEGEKIIYRFTEDNSPLLSNDVKKIAISPTTGEVYFGTFNGICSFRSTATIGNETNSNVFVFPNPVAANYNGTIAIKGLVDNAIVKIAELNGRLVYQTRSLGGQAIWNGKNYNGTKVASGVYLVIIRDENGTEKAVSKIVITFGR